MKRLFIVVLLLLNFFSLYTNALDVSAKAAVLINGTTGEILFGKNENQQLPMASTTKIMTALLLAEQNTPQKNIIVSEEMIKVEGSSMGLLKGDTVSYNDLLYGMLLASGNDAANVAAYCISGSIPSFAKLMNNKAKQLGLLDTNFVTPSGLDDDNHFTSAKNLAQLARYAMNNDNFAKAAGSKSATLCYGNPPYKRTLRNHNKLLNSYEGLIGVKTGFTKKSGRCLVTAARRSNEYLIAVTLNDPNDWIDHTNMLDYGFSVLSEYNFKCENTVDKICVVGGSSQSVMLKYDSLNIGISNNEANKIKSQIKLPKFVYAPIQQNQKIGEVIYFIDNEEIAKTDILAINDVNLTKENVFLDKFMNIIVFLFTQFQE